VSRAFPSYARSILTEIYLCHPCSCHEIEDGNPGRQLQPTPSINPHSVTIAERKQQQQRQQQRQQTTATATATATTANAPPSPEKRLLAWGAESEAKLARQQQVRRRCLGHINCVHGGRLLVGLPCC
jgi:hypothetical protein